MPSDDSRHVASFWNDAARGFDAIYTGEKSRISRLLDRTFRKDMYQRFDWVVEKSGNVRGRSIFDIGCGSGRYVREFAWRGAANITGLDIAPEMLKIASNLVKQHGVQERCRFVKADILDWQTNDRFDLTIAIGFWDYVAEPHARLARIRKLTKGRFLSTWPRFWTWRMPIRKIRLAAEGCPVYFFRRPDVYGHLRRAGFRVASCDVVGKLYCVDARPE